MTKETRQEYLYHLVYTNIDFFISLLLIEILYLTEKVTGNIIFNDYNLITTLFIAIFSVNFTVFALSKFLLENYPKIKRSQIKENIDRIFRIPLKVSATGVIVTLLFYMFQSSFLNNFVLIIYFLLFYSILSSYLVFKFIYEVSIKRGRS